MEMNPEQLNKQKAGKEEKPTPENIEITGEKNPSEVALAVADKIERKEADFLGQTEAIIKESPNLPEESLSQLEKISKKAHQLASRIEEEILGLVGFQEPQEICFKKYDRFGAKVEEIIDVPMDDLKAVGEEKIKQDLEREFFDEWGGLIDIKDIRYTTKDGKIFSIQKLLPPDWKLIRKGASTPEANSLAREVLYGPSFISRKGFFLILLHEIGHAHFDESLDKEELLRSMALADELDFKRNRRGLTPEETELYKKHVIDCERKAWAYALKTLRHLRKEGIDLAPELTSIKEILSVVMAALASYEKDLSPEDHEQILRVVFCGEIEKGGKFLKEALRK